MAVGARPRPAGKGGAKGVLSPVTGATLAIGCPTRLSHAAVARAPIIWIGWRSFPIRPVTEPGGAFPGRSAVFNRAPGLLFSVARAREVIEGTGITPIRRNVGYAERAEGPGYRRPL